MTRKQKTFLLLIVLLSLILKDSIFSWLLKHDQFLNTEIQLNDLEKDQLIKENAELSQQYGYTNFYPYELEYSQVLYKTPYNYQAKMTIYKGATNKVAVNNLVINDKGLVGLISQVYPHTSEVTLLTDESISLPVKVNSAYGTLVWDHNQLIVKDIKRTNEIKPGDLVYTSDISTYPQDILIGEVMEINLTNYDLEQVLVLSPSVNFADLNYVSIILTTRGEK